MTNQEILKIAMAQSAIDLCAEPLDFEKSENVIVTSRENDGARRYLRLPFSCQLVSYGNREEQAHYVYHENARFQEI